MKGNMIITGTITYAIRGRDLLRKNSMRASVERDISGSSRLGCGYGIAVYGDINKALNILNENGIKILEVAPII